MGCYENIFLISIFRNKLGCRLADTVNKSSRTEICEGSFPVSSAYRYRYFSASLRTRPEIRENHRRGSRSDRGSTWMGAQRSSRRC